AKVAVIGQTGNLTPADKKLYGLRDVTGTVNSIPLIASSIMSKKIAAGADAIVLDVKTGNGAFMKTIEDAEALAHAMVSIGNNVGRNTMAIISDMSQPLGNAIGNALEVKEASETMKGQGQKDLSELVMTLGSQMVVVGGKTKDLEEAQALLEKAIEDGSALESFRTFLENQDGDGSVVDDVSKLPQARFQIDLLSQKSGTVTEIIANEIRDASTMIGAVGETKKVE